MIPNTFGIPATADRYFEIHTLEELSALLSRDGQEIARHCLVVGSGSNIVFTGHYAGTVLHLENKGIRLLSESAEGLLVESAAGEVWDDFVRHCIAHGWHGAENLVAIPGTVGASPVQNVGAYGCEAKDIIHSVLAYDIATGEPRTFTRAECRFGYRDSIFKGELKNRYVVWSVTYRLRRDFVPEVGYKALSDALAAKGIAHPTAQQLADTIAEVRWGKLPRPEQTGSAGSFFKNPVVPESKYAELRSRFPDLVAYPADGGYKLAAGWLIERAGWKGRSLGRCGVYEKQALVLVNRGGCTGQEVVALAHAVVADVEALFGVTLTPEAIIV